MRCEQRKHPCDRRAGAANATGTSERARYSKRSSSIASSTAATGEPNVADMPAAAPDASRIFRSSAVIFANCPTSEPSAPPVAMMGRWRSRRPRFPACAARSLHRPGRHAQQRAPGPWMARWVPHLALHLSRVAGFHCEPRLFPSSLFASSKNSGASRGSPSESDSRASASRSTPRSRAGSSRSTPMSLA